MSTSGVSGSDTLNGTSGGEKLVGGGGSDTIDGGGGSDFINAGGGNDTIIYDQNDYKILGGGGIDTLLFLSERQNLNFGTQAITGIEALRLGGLGGHTVTFSAADVIRVSDNDRFLITLDPAQGATSSRLTIGSGWSFASLSADNKSQILTNGGASITVQLPIVIDGFSGNASIDFAADADRLVTEDDGSGDANRPLQASGSLAVDDLVNASQGLLSPELLGTELRGTGKLADDAQAATAESLGTLKLTLVTADSAAGAGEYAYIYSVNNGDVQFLGAGEEWKESFTVTTIDGTTKTLEFTVVGVNDAPQLTGTPATLSNGTEDTPQEISVADLLTGYTDVDIGDTLTVADITATNGTLSAVPVDGKYTFTPTANYNGPVTLKYNVIDDKGGSIAATRSFTLGAVNDAPVGTATATLTGGNEDTNYKISVTDLIKGFSDVDGDALSVSGLTATKGTLVNNNDGTYTFKPNADQNGLVNLNYNVIDGKGGVIGATQSFSLAAFNDPATITFGGNTEVKEDTVVTDGNLIATVLIGITDPDANEANISVSPKADATNVGTFLLQDMGPGNYTFAYSVQNNDPRVQALDPGISRSDYFTVKSVDGTSEITIEIKIIGTNFEVITGTPDNDVLNGTDADNQIEGLGGNDTINAGVGNDIVHGGLGDDSIDGGIGYDILYGDACNDTIFGGDFKDAIYGGEGNDVIDVTSSRFGKVPLAQSQVYGENGNDLFKFDATSACFMYGGSGSDTFDFVTRGAQNTSYIADFDVSKIPSEGGDILKLPFKLSELSLKDVYGGFSGANGIDILHNNTVVLNIVGVGLDSYNFKTYIGNKNVVVLSE